MIAATKFTRMPFFAALKEAKLRSFITPGQSLSLSAKLLHEGSGYAVTKAEIRCDGKLACNAEITFRLVEFPNAEFRASMEKMAAILEFPMKALTIQGSYVGSLPEIAELLALVNAKGAPDVPVATRPLEDVNAALNDPEVKASIEKLSTTVKPGTPEDLAELTKGDIERWGTLIKEQNITFN